jgi:heme exporter protein CcmD
MPEFLDFGKHTVHVWSAFGLTLVVMVLNIVAARRSLAERSKSARRRLTGDAVATSTVTTTTVTTQGGES